MKKLVFGAIVSYIFITGCVKSDTKCSYKDSNIVAPAAEIEALTDSLDTAGITGSQHSTGFFYKINNAGTGSGITNLCSNITVTYKGSYFNGSVFDSTLAGSAATFQLGQVIPAWQKGLPLVSKGGDITLYIPPSLGYGTLGYGSIPGNAYLIFDIHIIDIQ